MAELGAKVPYDPTIRADGDDSRRRRLTDTLAEALPDEHHPDARGSCEPVPSSPREEEAEGGGDNVENDDVERDAEGGVRQSLSLCIALAA